MQSNYRIYSYNFRSLLCCSCVSTKILQHCARCILSHRKMLLRCFFFGCVARNGWIVPNKPKKSSRWNLLNCIQSIWIASSVCCEVSRLLETYANANSWSTESIFCLFGLLSSRNQIYRVAIYNERCWEAWTKYKCCEYISKWKPFQMYLL